MQWYETFQLIMHTYTHRDPHPHSLTHPPTHTHTTPPHTHMPHPPHLPPLPHTLFLVTWFIHEPKDAERSHNLDPWCIHRNENHTLLPMPWGRGVRLSHEDTELAVRAQCPCGNHRDVGRYTGERRAPIPGKAYTIPLLLLIGT